MAAPRKRHARRSIATHRAAYGSFQVLEDRCLLAAAVLELDSEAGVAVDADGFVSRWVDQSGAENDLIAAGDERPDANAVTTPSGRSALSLDGVDDRLLRTLSEPGGISGLPDGNAARTVFLVAQFHDADAWGGFSYGAGGVNQAFGVGAVSSGAEAGELFLQGWGGGQDLFSGVDAFSSPGATSGWLVLSAVHSGDEAANTELFVNGISAASWSHAYNTNLASSAILNGNTFSRIVIGEEIREFGHVQMDVAAVRIYDDALSPSERGAIETSLTTRFITGGDAPVATADSAVVQLADLVQIDVLGNDTDNDSDLDPTSVNILTDPVSGTVTVDPVTGGVTYRHDGSANSASFTYTVSDLAGNVSNTATVDVTLASWSLDDFSDAEVTSGLNQPISIGFLPDERLLVLEKRGQIHIVDPNTGSRQLYMELTNINTQGERGLLDITLAPDFDPTAPGADYFYVYYTPAAPQLARIARFEHIENGGGLTSEGDVSSEFLVWEDTDGYVSCCHFGGGLDFGPDGKLWLTTSDKFTAPNPGETASFLPGGIGQPKNNIARDLTTGGGKIIRVNPDGSVPDGTDGWAANPYVDPVDDDPEVAGNQDYHDYAWGFGLRNPWRARWDLESERFFLAEVGGNQQAISYEDVHIATLDNPGADFGWNMCEGPGVSVYLPDGPCGEHELPIFSYGHNGVGASLTGGEVYRGDQFPAEWNGVYFYGDFTRDFIRFLTFDSTGEVSGDYPFKPTGEIPGVANQVVFIGVGADGSLYYVLLGGEVRRVTHDSTNSAPEILLATADPTSGDSPLTVNFTAQVTDAESDEITYTWHFGDGTTAAGTVTNGAANVSHTYNADGSFEAFLQVDDGQSVFSDVMAIEVGAPNVAPVIAAFEADPASGDLPLEVTFTASVSDADGDTLTWEINFGNGTTSGVQTVPQSGQISASFAYGTNGAFNAFLTVWDASEGTTSNPVTISAGQQSSIPITNGLVFLIESDIKVAVSSGTTVASWLDESGWGNNLDAFGDPQFVANATPGGQAAVVFDGDGDRLERLAAHTINQFPTGADDRTMFAVVNYVDSQGVWAGVSYGDSAVNETFGLVTDGVAGELTVQGYGTDLQSSTAGQGEGWAIQSVTVSAGEVTQFKDGTVIDSRAHTFATDLTGTSARLVIGEEIGGLGNSQMELAAVVLFDRALTAAERQQVEDYLHSKYFVGNAPPQAADDTVRAAANGTVAIDVLANDSDSDGVLNPATVQIIGQPTHGTVSVNPANGAITYTNDGEGTNDSFSYLVNDEVGASSNVATVDVAIGAGTLVGAGLVVHLESDAGVAVDSTTVQGWLDSSGNGNDLQTVVGTPQLVGDATPGGHSAIRFDGSQSLSRTETLNALPTGDEDRTVFLVAKYDATSVWAGASFGTGAPNQSFGLAVDGTGGDLTLAGWGAGNDFVSNAAGTGTGWLVQSVVLNDNRFEHYSTGSLVDSGFHQFDTGSTQLALAAEISGLGFVDMDMAAVLVYNRALSETERHEVEAYLFDKYFNAAINTPPEFTSPLSASIDENSVAVMTLTATDPDSDMLTYTVSGGADGSYFQITGDGPASHDHLEFINPPDFEVPLDADTDNEYEVEVSVFDGTDTTTSLVTVAVNDVEEPFFGDNLVLHLETDHGVVLDGSGVFEWQDQSDSGNDLFAAAGERPATNVTTTPNGSTAVSFDGQNDRLLRTTTDGLTALPDENAARTMVMVVRFHDAAAWGGAGWGAGAVNQAFGAGVVSSGGNEGRLFLQGWGVDLISASSGYTAPAGGGEWMVLSAVHVDDGTDTAANGFLFQDGTQVAQWNHQFATNLNDTGNLNGKARSRFVLGEEIAEFGHIEFDLAAVLVFDEALNSEDREAVETHLIDKYFSTNESETNTPPELTTTSPRTVNENSAAVTTLTATDADDNDLVFSISGGTDAVLFELAGTDGDELRFVSAPDFEAPGDADANNSYEVEITVSDGEAIESRLLSINVLDVDEGGGGQEECDLLTDGLAVCLDATAGVTENSGSVATWHDLSGNGNDVFATGTEQPVIGATTTPNGSAAISFDGANDRLLRTITDSGGISGLADGNESRTMFIVARFHDANAWGGVAWGTGAVNQAFGTGVVSSGGDEGDLMIQGWGVDLIADESGYTAPAGSGEWMVLSAVHVNDGTDPAANGFLYRDGIQIAAWNHQLATNLDDDSLLNGQTRSRLVLGEEIAEFGHIQLDLAAVVIYDQALEASDRAAVENDLAARFGI